MKKLFPIIAAAVVLLAVMPAGATIIWQRTDKSDVRQLTAKPLPAGAVFYATGENELRAFLFALPEGPAAAQLIELPLADGSFRVFKIWQTPIMPASLAAKYPVLRTFTAEAADDHRVTAKLDYTVYGFHAVVFGAGGLSFIDPAADAPTGYYSVHFKKDETRAAAQRMKCGVTASGSYARSAARGATGRIANGYEYRTYRLALACDYEYAQAATNDTAPSVTGVFSKMVTTMNRVNGVYEREIAVSLVFVAHEDTLIWTAAAGSPNGNDPFATIDDNAQACVLMNQRICDSLIRNENYDIGHVFTTGAGGLSQIGVVCQKGMKAESVTGQSLPEGDGFDIDFVAHEMGHELGASHCFNNGLDHSCGFDNINPPTAYEPGSGSTIMAYAGICSPDDLQPHSDAYFHSVSLEEIQSFLTTYGGGCAVTAATGNKLVSLPAFTASYAIPYLTPFELTAPAATDSAGDTSITYSWEQWNLGDVGQELVNTHLAGPIFRSYYPTVSPVRVFPRNSMVLAGVLSNAGTEDAEGEKAPDVARYLTFHLTMRDVLQGIGCFLTPDDTVHLDVINTGSGFTVTSQKGASQVYEGNTQQNVSWNVAGTNAAPINAANVGIYMSADGGNTWPYYIGSFPNNGSAGITIPNPDTTITAARIKVKGANNVFFNVNSDNFKVIRHVDVSVLPVPAHTSVHIATSGTLHGAIYNAIGAQAWKGQVTAPGLDIPLSTWARGVYIARLMDEYGHAIIKKLVVD